MLKHVDYRVLEGVLDTEVTGITYHSKQAKDGMVFVCIEGSDTDGHAFAKEAVDKGSAVIVCSKPLSFQEQVTIIQVKNTRKALAQMAAAYYDYPAKKLRLIGVTGTKGKTTVTYMLQKIFQQAGVRCGRIGTIEIDTVVRQYPSRQTTPESLELYKALREMVDARCSFAVVEISSQAMMQYRAYGITFDLGILTSIGKDHIGPKEHKDFEEYLYWKSQLFYQCRAAVMNMDTLEIANILENVSNIPLLLYSMKERGDIWVESYELIRLPGKLAVEFQAKGRYNIKLVIGSPGDFSVSNGLAAMAAAKCFGVEDRCIQHALREIDVPGRQTLFLIDYTRTVLVDYAHNGTSLEALLRAMRGYHPTGLTCVFGCGGERDSGRRQSMGEAAGKYADLTIITADNPRSESLDAINRDIIKGINVFSGNYCVIPERKEAIDYAVRHCMSGEIVVIAGKGHETLQIFDEGVIHFDDCEEVRSSIEKVKYEQDHNRRNLKSDGRTISFRRQRGRY